VSIVQKPTHYFREDEIQQKWYVVDVAGKTLGRVSSKVASILRGKHKPQYTPNADCGDFVIVINASKIHLTGKRKQQKEYFHYTGYPGGARWEKASELLKTKPERILEHSIKGMIHHNRLGKRIGMKLKIYSDANHPHVAQQPEQLSI